MIFTSEMTLDRLKSIKARCGKAPFGERRAAAWKHFYAAEAAHTANDSTKMKKELDAAHHLLSR